MTLLYFFYSCHIPWLGPKFVTESGPTTTAATMLKVAKNAKAAFTDGLLIAAAGAGNDFICFACHDNHCNAKINRSMDMAGHTPARTV